MGYINHAKSFTPFGWSVLFIAIFLGLFVEALLRSESNLQSLVAAVLSVSIMAIGLGLALNLGQKK
jgi:predicted branched-subunit amino acid permease